MDLLCTELSLFCFLFFFSHLQYTGAMGKWFFSLDFAQELCGVLGKQFLTYLWSNILFSSCRGDMLGQQGMPIPCPASTWHQLLLLTPASPVTFPEMFCQVLNGIPSEKCISRQYYCMNTIEHVYIDLHSIAYKRLHGLAYFFLGYKMCSVLPYHYRRWM